MIISKQNTDGMEQVVKLNESKGRELLEGKSTPESFGKYDRENNHGSLTKTLGAGKSSS